MSTSSQAPRPPSDHAEPARNDRCMPVEHGAQPALVSTCKGIGPKTAAMLRSVGVETFDQLQANDAFVLYAALKATVPTTSLNLLYALIGAQEGLHWQEIKRARRTEILLRLDEMGIAPK